MEHWNRISTNISERWINTHKNDFPTHWFHFRVRGQEPLPAAQGAGGTHPGQDTLPSGPPHPPHSLGQGLCRHAIYLTAHLGDVGGSRGLEKAHGHGVKSATSTLIPGSLINTIRKIYYSRNCCAGSYVYEGSSFSTSQVGQEGSSQATFSSARSTGSRGPAAAWCSAVRTSCAPTHLDQVRPAQTISGC